MESALDPEALVTAMREAGDEALPLAAAWRRRRGRTSPICLIEEPLCLGSNRLHLA
ncbi:hypothetical protein DEA8626_04045 [Defluviimonas aquaemixtae]|uniref:Uncharacterized protein n=1 Tax=Albidovulum aquaemixtae TaxID=1542388 RepID=A0A2R8BNI5_9RHOB|nr:hypothetical protein DEA8626_04045 [Defluviimonas aquaemixtae]